MENNVISLITQSPSGNFIFFLKIISVGFSLILLVLIVLLLGRTNWLKFRITQDLAEIITFKSFGTKKVLKQWMKIKERLETTLESEFKLAIIEADAMLDDVFKKMGYKGESLAERLKEVNVDILSNIEQVSQAHQIRNNIVHDPDYRLNLEETKKVISFYETALTDLGMI